MPTETSNCTRAASGAYLAIVVAVMKPLAESTRRNAERVGEEAMDVIKLDAPEDERRRQRGPVAAELPRQLLSAKMPGCITNRSPVLWQPVLPLRLYMKGN